MPAGSSPASGTGSASPDETPSAQGGLAAHHASRWVRLRFRLEPHGAVWSHQAVGARTPADDGDPEAHNHVLLDPEAAFRVSAPGFVRPVELWRSPHWRRRESATVVRYTFDDTATDAAPPGDAVNRITVAGFLADVSAFRLGALGLLLDAVALALDGGPPVVLAAQTADEGALWVGAVSFFAAPAVCLRLSFSTYERLDDVLERRTAHPALISVVPEEDVDGLRPGDELPVTVVDPRVEARLTSTNGVEERESRLGARVPVTDWSRLAVDVCCEERAEITRVLATLDRISVSSAASSPPGTPAAGLAGGEDDGTAGGPAWPLAAAIAVTGGFTLAMPTATRVLLRDTPESVRLGDDLARSVADLLSAGAHDAADAWAALEHAITAPSAGTAHVLAAFEGYVGLALADDGWLLRPAPLPDAVPEDPGLAERLAGQLTAATARLLGAPAPVAEAERVQRGVLLLSAVDLVERLARLVGDLRPADTGAPELAAEAAALLGSPAGPRIADAVGVLEPGTVRRLLPGVRGLAQGSRLALPAAVAGLLAPGIDVDRVLTLPPARLAEDPLLVEILVAAATGRVTADPRLRGPAAEYLLHELALDGARPAEPTAAVAEVFERVDGGRPWTAAEILRLAERAHPELAPSVVPAALARVDGWGAGEDAARTAAELLKRVEFVVARGRQRRAGVTDGQIDLLRLLAATGPGWALEDDGLHRRAADVLHWADGAWPGTDPGGRRALAPRVVVAAIQVALAAEYDPAPSGPGSRLRQRIGVSEPGSTWRACLPLGYDAALGTLHELLALNRYRLAGELVSAATRAMIGVPPPAGDAAPALAELPVGPLIRSLVGRDDAPPELLDHLAALVAQELRQAEIPQQHARRIIAFWERALPGADFLDYAPPKEVAAAPPRAALAAPVPEFAQVAAAALAARRWLRRLPRAVLDRTRSRGKHRRRWRHRRPHRGSRRP